ncbi:hypothetical protein OnM2_089004 [Erysiphe neolycopersici]|uniref:Uncharacterized protein n=1 Tax=Erysiphe neolycopersici TaxID=212602 RepID=A0A420HDH2_9PEZI|nr:hypothetical protein OnM2_089004 [Erysiphe neolycopersici]
MARSSGVHQRLRGYDSWIDIPSQNSSQSQSPINNEIVTTGLTIQKASNIQRRRRAASRSSSVNVETRGTSSQEEYEESESDEDHILTSSNEHLETNSPIILSSHDVDSDSDRDETSKQLSKKAMNSRSLSDPKYNPQQMPSDQCRDEIENFSPPFSTNIQPLYSSRNSFNQHLHRHPADHDAALRASLTTLLSIGAAAARGLPNRETNTRRGIVSRDREFRDSIDLRFVSESELMSPSQPQSPLPITKSTINSQRHPAFKEKNERMTTSMEKVKAARQNHLVSQENNFSSNFLTWAVSAGVLVIISVVGFGVGYAIGREVGRQENLAGISSSALGNSSTFGKETMRSSSGGLHHFKWNTGGVSRNFIT